MYTKSKSTQGVFLKQLPALLYLLIAVAAGLGFFRGENLKFTIPIFLLVTRVNMLLYVKYHLTSWGLYLIYALLAVAVIFFKF